MADANQLARSAVERLSEDESLRGELSDIGFGPLLDWAVAAVKAYAAKAANSDAMDQYTGRVRGVVQAVVEVAQAGKLDDPAALLDFEPANRDKAQTALKALSLGEDPDANAEQIATVLQAALTEAPASPAAEVAPTKSKPAAAVAVEAPPIAATAGEASPTAEPTPEVKKNAPGEVGEAKTAQVNVPQQNPESTAPPAISGPPPGAFFDGMKSKMGQAYNSAWGIFKGLSKRRS